MKIKKDAAHAASFLLATDHGLFLRSRRHALLLDTGLLTGQIAEVVDAGAANHTNLVDLDLLDMGRVEREDTFDAHTVGNLADGEHLGLALTLDLDHYTAEALQALLVTLDDLVRHGDGITGIERRYVGIRLGPQLLVYELDDCVFVHCCNEINGFRIQHSRCTSATIQALCP